MDRQTKRAKSVENGTSRHFVGTEHPEAEAVLAHSRN
jgi:hypothetical protein